jgi:hypothetical protein
MKLIAMILIVGVAHAQGLTTSPPGGGGKSTPLFTPDANVVVHVWWDGTALVAGKGPAWSMSGTVPQVAKSLSPVKPPRGSAGPFTTANYYYLGTGSDVLDFVGDFTACGVFKPNALADGYSFMFENLGAITGWGLYMNVNNGAMRLQYGTGSSSVELGSNGTAAAGVANVVCAGRSGGTYYIKLNGNTTASVVAAYGPDSTTIAKIGTFGANGTPGVLIELYATTTAWNETAVSAIQAKVLARRK